MVGTLVGATALIPIIGAYIGAIVGSLMVLTQSGPWQMLFFILFIIVLQQLEGNLIYPKVVGSSVGLPGIWVLAAVTIGGSINGIFGMLLGVPTAATIYRLLGENSQKRVMHRVQQNQKIPTDLLKALTPEPEAVSSETKSEPESEQQNNNSDGDDVLDEIVSALDTDEN